MNVTVDVRGMNATVTPYSYPLSVKFEVLNSGYYNDFYVYLHIAKVNQEAQKPLTVSMQDWTYGGQPNTPTVTGWPDSHYNDTVAYSKKDGTALSGVPTKAGKYKVTVTCQGSDNNIYTGFADFQIKPASDGYEVNFGTDLLELTYGKSYTVNPTGKFDSLTYTVESGKDVISVNEKTGEITTLKSGVATIFASNKEGNYVHFDAELSVRVSKATVTVTAKDQTAYAGDSAPDLTDAYALDGLVGEDTLNGTISLSYANNLDMNTPGEYEILVTYTGTDDRYDVTPVPGSLTVSPQPTYTVHFDPNGGEGAMVDQTVPQNKREGLKPNTLTRTGYTFTGWNAQADGKGTDYTDGQEVSDLTTNGGTVTLYAQWKPNTYTLTFQTKGGSEVKPLTQAYGTAIVAPTAPTRKGYTFAGWEPEMPETMPAKNMTLTAKWTVNSYTIHFDANGGTGTMKDLTASYGQIQTLSTNVYTLAGHKFHGWNTRSDGTGTAYEDTQMVQNLTEEDKKSIILYAQWDKILERVDLTLSGHIFDKSVEQVKVTSQDAIVFRDPTYDGSWGITKDQKKLTTLSGKLFQADKQYYLWVKFSAKEGYALDGLTTKDVHLDGTEPLSLTEKEGTITAVFRLPVIYTIQVTVGKNGSVDADNVLRVFEGENVTIKITPDSGYVVYRLEIDGTNVTTTRTYTFQNVQQSHTFKVRFLKNGSNAKTGDSFPLFPATATLALSAIALTATFLVAKKKRRIKIAR